MEKYLKNVPEFTGNENYWIVSSGKQKDLYQIFRDKKYIGFAYDKISVNEVKGKNLEEIKTIYKRKYSKTRENYKTDSSFNQAITIISKEINYFVNEIALGDIIVLKDRAKKQLIFGKVNSEIFSSNEDIDNLFIDYKRGNCNKFLSVEWLRVKEQDIVSEKLKNAIRVTQAVFKVKDEDTVHHINKTIYSIFKRNDKTGYFQCRQR